MAWRKSRSGTLSRIVMWIFVLSGCALILFNLVFVFQTASELAALKQNERHDSSAFVSALSGKTAAPERKENTPSRNEPKYLEIEVFSSQKNVTLTLNGKVRFDKSEMLLRGLNIVVLNEVTGEVLSSQWFDTYEDSGDSQRLMDFLQGLKKGRILCFAVKDEAVMSLSESARVFLTSYGSAFIKDLQFRSMWAFVVQRMETRNIVHAESFQHKFSTEKWGSPVKIRTSVQLLSENVEKCSWEDSVTNRRRREFCEKFEGYGDVCSCESPSSLSFDPPAFPDGSRLSVPVAVMAGNRPHYLLRMLRSLRDVHGLDPSMVTVFIDGFFDEPLSVSRMFGLMVEQHAGESRRNSRICQHYKKSLTASFDKFPDANYLVILEEDLDLSVDILSYFKQLLPVLEKDESVYCISAWNDQGYDHLSNDPAMTYRIETMPGLGWVLSRKLYKGELEEKWPKPDQFWDWDMWTRMPQQRKGRECIIPDISRTYHFGAKGLNVGGFMQAVYFQKHALNKEPNVQLDADKMFKDNYEDEIKRLIGEAEILDHSKSPCANLKDFVPDTKNKQYLFYIRMDNPRDYTTWNNVARCFRMWDLDPRGFHNSMWRFWIKQNHIIVVGCPASMYCSSKPKELEPIYLPKKETRPRGDDGGAR